jgi:hypothetical protein
VSEGALKECREENKRESDKREREKREEREGTSRLVARVFWEGVFM